MNLLKKLLLREDPKPVAFPQVNFTYTKPASMTDEECGSLPCFRSPNFTVSCWSMALRDRLRVLVTGKVWLTLVMNGHPPVSIGASAPFAQPEGQKPEPDPVNRFLKLVVLVFVLSVAFAAAGGLLGLKLVGLL